MISFQLEPTITTPSVEVDEEEGEITISGRSSPENSVGFYQPLLDVMDSLSESPRLVFNFALEYFNTSSGKCLFDIIRKAGKFTEEGSEIEINWFYDPEDEDMREIGEDYEDILDLEFNYLMISA